MMCDPIGAQTRVLLVGGTSHAGKSTLASALATRLGWACHSTDQLARHPGRPWRTPPNPVREHVAQHYLSLSVDELVADVLGHYRETVWPLVTELVASYVTHPGGHCLVLEGSALLPELVVTLPHAEVGALWLTAGDELLTRRIRQASDHAARSPVERMMIEKFLERTCRFNAHVVESVRTNGLRTIDVEPMDAVDERVSAVVTMLQGKKFSCASRPPPHPESRPAP